MDVVEAEPVSTLSGSPAIEVADDARPPVRRGSQLMAFLGLAVVVVSVGVTVFGGGPAGTDVRAMPVGACYTQTDVIDDGGHLVPLGTDTPCLSSAPRVVANLIIPDGPYPGTDYLQSIVADRCGGEQYIVIGPTSQCWAGGDRTVVCIALP